MSEKRIMVKKWNYISVVNQEVIYLAPIKASRGTRSQVCLNTVNKGLRRESFCWGQITRPCLVDDGKKSRSNLCEMRNHWKVLKREWHHLI